MTDSHRKRKYAGPTIAEKRKIVPEPPKHGHKPKPRTFVLKVIEVRTTEYEWTHKYPTKKARDQAKADFKKKSESEARARKQYKWYRAYTQDVKFEEFEE